MKTSTAINRILTSDKSTSLKILKLQNLALRTMAASPAQRAVNAAKDALKAGETITATEAFRRIGYHHAA